MWFFLGGGVEGVGLGVQMGILAVEDETREIQKDQLVRSFMYKTRQLSSFPESTVLSRGGI